MAQVTVYGAGPYAMRVWVNPDAMGKLGLTVPDVVNALQKQNTVNPAGQVGAEPAPGTRVHLLDSGPRPPFFSRGVWRRRAPLEP